MAPGHPKTPPNGPKTPPNASKAPQSRSKVLLRCSLHRLLQGFGTILETTLIERWPFFRANDFGSNYGVGGMGEAFLDIRQPTCGGAMGVLDGIV